MLAAATSFEHWSLVWLAVQAIATALTLLGLAAAAALALSQLRESTRARRLQAAVTVIDQINSPGLRRARRYALTQHADLTKIVSSNPSWKELDEAILATSGGSTDLDSLHTYFSSLENVAMLVMHDIAPDGLVDMYMHGFALRHRDDLEPFIAYMRRRYRSDEFLQHFELMTALMQERGLAADGPLRDSLWKRLTNKSRRRKREMMMERYERRLKEPTARRADPVLDADDGDPATDRSKTSPGAAGG